MSDFPNDDDGPDDGRSPPDRKLTYELDETESPSAAVVRAVASFTDSHEHDLEPLYEAVDPDALDALFEGGPDGETADGRSVRFRFAGCRVRVTWATGQVSAPVEDGS
jgi:hypothetical protein